MSSDSPPAAQEPDAGPPPSLLALFAAFAKMSLAGFGG
ncbi:chromate transporter, partial [Bradyrhizobium guangdongense]